jgi:hypothetical protein
MNNSSPAWATTSSTNLNAPCAASWPSPNAGAIRGDNRKLNFQRFPYAIVYNLRPDAIYIKAVMHLHRRPFYWRDRQ